MMRKKASKFFGSRQSEDLSRPSSSAYNPLRFPTSASSTALNAQPRPTTQPRTLVMSTADIWEREEEQDYPRLSLDPSIFDDKGVYDPEPLFHESFLESWHTDLDSMPSMHFSRPLSRLQNEIVYYEDDDIIEEEPELSNSDYEDDLDDFVDDDFPPEPAFAICVNIVHAGMPKLIDISPPLSPMSYRRPQVHNRYGSVSSHTSSDESDGYGSTFSHHSSASSVSDWTRSGHVSLPNSPTVKSSRRSSDDEKNPIPVPPRSSKRTSVMNKSRQPAIHDDSDSVSDNGSSSSSTYNYEYDWSYLNNEAAQAMRRIQAIEETA